VFFCGEGDILPNSTVKNNTQRIFSRLRRVKCRILPPENPNCRIDRFDVGHIFVAAGAGSHEGSIWRILEKPWLFNKPEVIINECAIELPSWLARYAAPD